MTDAPIPQPPIVTLPEGVLLSGKDWPTPEHHTIAVHLDSYDTLLKLLDAMEGLTVRVEVDPRMINATTINPQQKYELGSVVNDIDGDWIDLDIVDDHGEIQDKVIAHVPCISKVTVL